jgi:hypothetical protein
MDDSVRARYIEVYGIRFTENEQAGMAPADSGSDDDVIAKVMSGNIGGAAEQVMESGFSLVQNTLGMGKKR